MNTQISDLSEIDVAILAGGLGTRLQPVVKGKPKVLAQVGKRPFLEYILNQLNSANFKKVVLCTGYLSDQVEKTFGDRYKKLYLLYSVEKQLLGTAGGLKNALPLLNSETVLVMNGDSYCEVNFKKLWQFHLSKKSKATIVLSQVTNTKSYGKVQLGNDASIIEFKEKKSKMGGGLVSAGIYLINRNLIDKIPKDKPIYIETHIFPKWIGKGFYGYKDNSKFIDMGTPESYAKAEQFFENAN